ACNEPEGPSEIDQRNRKSVRITYSRDSSVQRPSTRLIENPSSPKVKRTLLIVLSLMALTSLTSSHPVYAAGIDDEICNVDADFPLGAEDYAEAIRLHREVVRTNPQNALAHYHLGYAEGMIGHRDQELEEYRRAKALGLETWDLYLNQGLALLDRDE